MDDEQILKSTQEQAVASWVNQLNQIRLDDLMEKLTAQDCNLEDAWAELQELKYFISAPEHILGSLQTKHGEIAEHIQVNFSNARNLIKGLKAELTFDNVPRTAPEDYLSSGNPVQSKFLNGAERTFDAIQKHLKDYPDFLKSGGYNSGNGYYDIPRDQYDQITECLRKPSSQLSRSEWRLAEKVRAWESANGIHFEEKVRPSVAGYQQVQQGKIQDTIHEEEKNILREDRAERDAAYIQSKPTAAEGARAAGVSAAIEGGTHFVLAVHRKLKEGKKLAEFTAEDWKNVGLDTAQGTVTGGIRGAAIYGMTNFTATPAAVASAFVTAAVGITAQAKQLEQGAISEDDFVCNSTVLCLDVSISAIASLAGQVLIPIPVLGAVVGNCVGMFYWGICKEYASEREQRLAESYRQSVDVLNEQLDARYADLMAQILAEFKKFVSVQELAFDEDVNRAFEGSVALARYVGVPEEKILSDTEKIDHFFMD